MVVEGEYEALRAANMKRNNEIMRALGLDLSDFKLHKEHKDAGAKSKGVAVAKSKPQPRKRKENDGDDVASSPATTRKSSRIRGGAPEREGANDPDDELGNVDCVDHQSFASDEQHDAAERDHLRWAGKQGKATIVGTASYKHTLHRVGRRCNVSGSVNIYTHAHTHTHTYDVCVCVGGWVGGWVGIWV